MGKSKLSGQLSQGLAESAAKDKAASDKAVADIEKTVTEIVTAVAQRVVPSIVQKAAGDALNGLLPEALVEAVDVFRAAPVRCSAISLREWEDRESRKHSPVPGSDFKLVHAPRKGCTVTELRLANNLGITCDAMGRVTLYPGARAKLPCGVKLTLPEGFDFLLYAVPELFVRGVAVHSQIVQGEEGEACVVLCNEGPDRIEIMPGAALATFVVIETLRAELFEETCGEVGQEQAGESK